MAGLPMDLHSLNQWVGYYASTNSDSARNIDKKMVIQNKSVTSIYFEGSPTTVEYAKYRGVIDPILSKYKVIQNSGGGRNDCLIISFLMGVSENYRNLSYTKKYSVSNEFRRNILPEIIVSANKTELGLTSSSGKNTEADIELRVLNILKELKGRNFLFDNIIGLLSKIYKIFIITLEPGKGDNNQYQPPSIIENGLVINKAMPIVVGNEIPKVYNDGIIICNMYGNGHFEILTKDNIYLFTNSEGLKFYEDIYNNNPYKFEQLIENAKIEGIFSAENRAAAKVALETPTNSNNNELAKAIALSLGPAPSRSRRTSSRISTNYNRNFNENLARVLAESRQTKQNNIQIRKADASLHPSNNADVMRHSLNSNAAKEATNAKRNLEAVYNHSPEFMDAAFNGHLDTITNFINKEIDINTQDEYGFTALMWAVLEGHLEIVTKLLKTPGINVNKKNIDGFTALMIAASESNIPVIATLLKRPDIDMNVISSSRDSTWNKKTALILLKDNGGLKKLEKFMRESGDYKIFENFNKFFRQNGNVNPRNKPRNLTKFHPKKREEIERMRRNTREKTRRARGYLNFGNNSIEPPPQPLRSKWGSRRNPRIQPYP